MSAWTHLQGRWHLARIRRYWTSIAQRQTVARQQMTAWASQRQPVTPAQADAVRAPLIADLTYLAREAPPWFAIDARAAAFWDQSGDEFRATSAYQTAVQEWAGLRVAAFALQTDWERMPAALNQVLARHRARAAEWDAQWRTLRADYLARSTGQRMRAAYADTEVFFREASIPDTDPMVRQFLASYADLDHQRAQWNAEYLVSADRQYRAQLAVEGKALDTQQRTAILTDDDQVLVLAGAGSGKTLTIAGNVQWLMREQGVPGREILLLAFTRNAAKEMEDRVVRRLELDVTVQTFHALGRGIIREATGSAPEIMDDLGAWVQTDLLQRLRTNAEYAAQFVQFWALYRKIPVRLEDFDSMGAYWDAVGRGDLETLRSTIATWEARQKTGSRKERLHTAGGEHVKSLEEAAIGNFLFLHGVDYEYERVYEYPTTEAEQGRRGKYLPDFYLPAYQLYLEHFGINAAGKAPWLDSDAANQYVADMKWKRQLHAEHGTTLLETYSYYQTEGILLSKLEAMLVAHGVVFRPVDMIRLAESLYRATPTPELQSVRRLIVTYLELFKARGYTVETFALWRAQTTPTPLDRFSEQRERLWWALLEPMFVAYQAALAARGQIDFQDMIYQAAAAIRSKRVTVPYRYIIVDEYQDLAHSQSVLIQAIREQTQAKLFGVGDDWQSIYRFAGADLALLTQFERVWGPAQILRIEQTYRNPQELIDIAGAFVMRNPAQLPKTLRSTQHVADPIQLRPGSAALADAVAQVIREEVTAYGPDRSFLLLGRYNQDLAPLTRSSLFQNASTADRVRFREAPALSITFLTVHRAKGLEADCVIVLNAANDVLGFPSQVVDDPLLNRVLADPDSYPHAEERRLFYVALTRTRNRVYVMVPERPSDFVRELITRDRLRLSNAVNQSADARTEHRCPWCRTGLLVPKTSRYGPFWGCSHYPRCTFKTNRSLGHSASTVPGRRVLD